MSTFVPRTRLLTRAAQNRSAYRAATVRERVLKP
jgi:hypothetical protein